MSYREESRAESKNLAGLTRTENNETIITALVNGAGWDDGSQNSGAQIIRETRTFTVEVSGVAEDHV